jgi:hypothetical protein
MPAWSGFGGREGEALVQSRGLGLRNYLATQGPHRRSPDHPMIRIRRRVPTIRSGTHALELEVARANDRGVGDVSFLVAGSPTLLIPEVEGQPQAGEIRPVTVTVRSEAGVPIPGATVVLSGTQEILRGKTDAAGQVVFQTFPPDGRPYRLTVEKMGYAGATTEVAVGWLRLYLPLVLRNR